MMYSYHDRALLTIGIVTLCPGFKGVTLSRTNIKGINMRAVMVMFDSLNRRMLEPYGSTWTQTPNFTRLAKETAMFENSYIGSMPCMPARREIHTGRYNFLHRSWGPIEPFDDSMPELLNNNGIRTHLVTDHYHYWEDGGATYHTRYGSFEISRGQEGDNWKTDLRDSVPIPDSHSSRPSNPWRKQDWVNRSYMKEEKEFSQAKTFNLGEEFIHTNHGEDNWFLQIETFDPHEPYFSPQKYKDLYPHSYDGPTFDWPPYAPVSETPEEVEHMRMESAALHSMCDRYMGKVIDLFDTYNLWEDTMLIVNTDHGFLLGEHDWWAKCSQPFFNEISHTPLFIWDPRSRVKGKKRSSLVQTIDLAPTLLDYFKVNRPASMQGFALASTIADDTACREAGLFGMFGGHVNVTDGRYVYMRAAATPENSPLFEYTLMPTHMRGLFETDELQDIRLAEPYSFTKGCRTMKIASRAAANVQRFGTMLFDTQSDPAQETPLSHPETEKRMIALMVELMKANDAPEEQFVRLGLLEYV
jgi:arylsulfatase A-like enzyme